MIRTRYGKVSTSWNLGCQFPEFTVPGPKICVPKMKVILKIEVNLISSSGVQMWHPPLLKGRRGTYTGTNNWPRIFGFRLQHLFLFYKNSSLREVIHFGFSGSRYPSLPVSNYISSKIHCRWHYNLPISFCYVLRYCRCPSFSCDLYVYLITAIKLNALRPKIK